MGTVSPQLAGQIKPGDTVQTAIGEVRITDAYRAPAHGKHRIFVRVGMEGELVETDGGERFEFGQEPIRIGSELKLVSDRYKTGGEIISGPQADEALERLAVETLLNVRVSATNLESLGVGDEFVIGGETIATIETVEVYGTGNPDVRRALIGVTYRTVAPLEGVGPEFGTTMIREGETLPFETDAYDISGEVQRVNALEPRGEIGTRTVTLELEDVNERRATQFQAGMTETVGGETIAELTDVEISDYGGTAESGDRERRTVTMTAELQVRETPSGPRFKNEPLREGDTIALEFESTSVDVVVVHR